MPDESNTNDLANLTDAVIRFRDERNWGQFHNTKDLLLSLVLEASELAELSQWRNGDELEEYLAKNHEPLEDELADVFYWLLVIAHKHKIELGDALRSKLIKNAAKYPVEKAFGRKEKYTQLD